MSLFLKIRGLQCLQNLFHYSYRYYVIPASIYLSKWEAAMVIYAVVKFQDLSAVKLVFASVMYYFFLYASLTSAGKAYLEFGDILKKWRINLLRIQKGVLSKNSRCMIKRLESVQPLAFYVGEFYFITIDSLLTILDEIINNTITLLYL